ncbi:MAG: hypothetical protein QNJ68_10370 [Microcoleaceae cyanobacterium MO_207.B10]|nr:hypothetical protein [Microcoleaceae cyanobacterium MO_207.B10]
MYTDNFGTWQQICNNYFPTTQWQVFPTAVDNSSLFRLTFFTDWVRWKIKYSAYKSYGLIRFVYDDGNVTANTKIYLREEPFLMSLPSFPEINVTRKLALARRFWRQADWIENHPDMDLKWAVTIDSLVG